MLQSMRVNSHELHPTLQMKVTNSVQRENNQTWKLYDSIYITSKKKAKPIYMLEISLAVTLEVERFVPQTVVQLIVIPILFLPTDCCDGQ